MINLASPTIDRSNRENPIFNSFCKINVSSSPNILKECLNYVNCDNPEVASLTLTIKKLKNEFEKDKALMMQKIELMDMQLEEAKIRETNLKRMHSSMLLAFNSTNTAESQVEPNLTQEIEALKKENTTVINESKKLKLEIEYNENKVNDLSSYKDSYEKIIDEFKE